MIRYLYYRSFLTSSLMYLLFPKGGHSKKEKEKREKRSQSLTFFHHFFLFIAFILKKEFLVGWKRNYGQKFNTLLIESECKTCHWIWFVELPKLSCFLAIAYLDIELNKTSLMWHTEITSIWKKLLMMVVCVRVWWWSEIIQLLPHQALIEMFSSTYFHRILLWRETALFSEMRSNIKMVINEVLFISQRTSKVSKMIIWKFNILEFKRGVKLGSQRTESF